MTDNIWKEVNYKRVYPEIIRWNKASCYLAISKNLHGEVAGNNSITVALIHEPDRESLLSNIDAISENSIFP